MISAITIENFRGFRQYTSPAFAAVTVIGGKNNAGKSSLLEALSLTFDNSGAEALMRLNRVRGLNVGKVSDLGMLFSEGNMESDIVISSHFAEKGAVETKISHKQPSVSIAESSSGASMPVDSITRAMEYEERLEVQVQTDVSYVFGLNGTIANTQVENKTPTVGCCVWPGFRQEGWDVLVELYKQDSSDIIFNTLHQVDARVLKVQPIDRQIYVKMQGVKNLIPLASLGDGAVKIAMTIARLAAVPEGGVCAFDEIENGLHYSAMQALWQALVEVANARQVQLIAATHSLEMLHAMSNVAAKGEASDFAYFRMASKKDGEIVTARYDYPAFKTHLEEDFELR